MRILIITFIASRVILLVAIYIVSGVLGKLAYPKIGVTSAYATDPSRAIAAFILPISAMINLTVGWLRLRRMRFLLHSVYHWISWTGLAVMLVTLSMGLFGLGALVPSTNVALYYVASSLWYSGAIFSMVLATVLNWQVGLIQPRYLRNYRYILTVLVLGVSMALALTIGWVEAASSILEIVLSTMTALYTASYMHDCEFPMRSSCPFAYPASIPPIPPGKEEHASLFLKEAD